ncbi:phage major capsid protein [Deinococcus marmoris]|uniref:Phage major capsid protein n=1 Tax=Deinococcus marmoris TaxID=249408 RepID=A0A1U7P4W0_9DEIO|nr:hypothetical protein [Deinococcus marmoris]OLV20215.1 hypothetical protein BOO71_0000673 [Deinococcus marmoris]
MSKYVTKISDINLDLKGQAKAEGLSFEDKLTRMAEAGHLELGGREISGQEKDAQGHAVPVWKEILSAQGIETRGRHQAATVNDVFFTDPDNKILFPLYIEGRFREINNYRPNQLRITDLVADMVPVTTGAMGMDTLTDSDDAETDPARIAEGAEFPVLVIKSAGKTIILLKRGGRLEATYEAIAGASVSTFNRWLTRLARRTETTKIRAALAMLKNGDGGNAAPNVASAGAAYTIGDIVKLIQRAGDFGAEPMILTGDTTEMGALFALDFLSSPANNGMQSENLRENGTLPRLLGMMPKFAPTRSVMDGSKQLMAIDPALGLTMAYNPAMDLVEYDAVIERQIKAVQISEQYGFGKPDIAAAVTLTRTGA